MIARAALALFALAAVRVRAEPSIWVEVSPNTEEPEPEEVERRYTPELVQELQSANDDALLLYTEFTDKASTDIKKFLRNMSGLRNETLSALDWSVLNNASKSCSNNFKERLSKIEYDAQRAASFSGENHHKFFLGHMIVFRMHLNKSEDYIRKCDKVVRGCGIRCETTPKLIRWRRLAAEEIHRVREDLLHSRRSYRDLLLHAHKRLNTLRRQATAKTKHAIEKLQACVREET